MKASGNPRHHSFRKQKRRLIAVTIRRHPDAQME
jgi:hypothetical protein